MSPPWQDCTAAEPFVIAIRESLARIGFADSRAPGLVPQLEVPCIVGTYCLIPRIPAADGADQCMQGHLCCRWGKTKVSFIPTAELGRAVVADQIPLCWPKTHRCSCMSNWKVGDAQPPVAGLRKTSPLLIPEHDEQASESNRTQSSFLRR
jgi:hypothetical protein